jgi:hypothetical protein
MQYIKARTSISGPTVYGVNGREGRSNAIGCRFILMERMPGTQLAYLWFDKESTPGSREQLRARALQTIAAAMVQLNKIKAPQSGGLQLNPGGSFSNTVPAKIANPYRVGNNDEWCKKPASKNPAESLTFMNDRYPPISQSNMIEQGNRLFRRGLVDWAMQMTPIEDNKQFILTHTDFDLQNILVENDGTLYGVIDWDCAAAVPQHVGCLSYSKWLLKDRDPHHYHPGLDTQQRRALRVEPDSCPEELNHYRAMYAQFVEREFSVTEDSETSRRAADITRMSLIMANLQNAESDPSRAPEIVETLFEGIKRLTQFEDPPEESESRTTQLRKLTISVRNS